MSKPTSKLDDKIDKEQTLGTLIVVLLKARNLHDRHSFRKQDVFAQATLNGVEKRTHVDVRGGQHPVWDGEVRFAIMKNAAAKHRKLEVACYAKERDDDLLGKGIVDISETLRTGEFDDWVSLDIDGVARGELYLEMTYYANKPAPAAVHNHKLASVLSNNPTNLQRRPSKLSPFDRLSRPGGVASGQHGPGPSTLAPSPSYSPSQTPPKQHHPRPSGSPSGGMPASLMPSYPSGVSPKGRNDALPALPADGTTQAQAHAHAQAQTPLPASLRPGPGGPSPSGASAPLAIPRPQQRHQQYGHIRHPSASPPSHPGHFGQQQQYEQSPHGSPPQGGADMSANPYIGAAASVVGVGGSSSAPGLGAAPGLAAGRAYRPVSPPATGAGVGGAQAPPAGQGHNPYLYLSSQPLSPATGPAVTHNGNGTPLIWQQDNYSSPGGPSTVGPGPGPGGFSFPMPVMSPGRESYGGAVSGRGGYPGSLGAPSGYGYPNQRPPPSGRDDHERDWEDPYRQARYQTPLPLPPGAEASRPAPLASAPTRAPAPDPASAATPAPIPVPAPTETPPPAWSPRTPPKATTSTPAPDSARLEALRRAEEAAKRRKEQEERDLELAMQLDRELNLAEEAAARSSNGGGGRTEASMPGQW